MRRLDSISYTVTFRPISVRGAPNDLLKRFSGYFRYQQIESTNIKYIVS
jgi:hypothetical protein